MISTKVVVILAALCAIQGFANANVVEPRADEILNIIEKVIETIQATIANGIKQLGDVAAIIKELAEKLMGEAGVKLQEIVSNTIKIIADLKNTAEKYKVDVKECVDGKEEQIPIIAQKTLEETLNCIRAAIAQVDEIIAATKTEIEGMVADILALKEELFACKDLKCRLSVLAKANNYLIYLPIKVGKVLIAATNKLIALKVDIMKCVFEGAKILTAEIKPILTEITTCIEDKMNNKNYFD